MIDLKLAKEIGATHYIDDEYKCLYRIESGRVMCYKDGSGTFGESVLDDEDLTLLERIDFFELEKADYDNGMREAMKKIAKSCGKSFGVDIGYEDLPDLVESIVNPKPETVTEYVLVTDSIFDLRDAFEDGELYYKITDGTNESYGCITDEIMLSTCFTSKNIYHIGEKPVDWEDVVQEFVEESLHLCLFDNLDEIINSPLYSKERKEFTMLIKRLYPLVK